MILAITSLSLILACRAGAQKFMPMGVTDGDMIAYLQKLQRAVRAGDRPTVASLVNYPLRVNSSSKRHFTVTSSADLIRRYDAVFVPGVRDAIIAQEFGKLSASPQGVPIKGGMVWLMSVCDAKHQPVKCKVGVGAINLPETFLNR